MQTSENELVRTIGSNMKQLSLDKAIGSKTKSFLLSCALVILCTSHCASLALSKLPPHAGYHGESADPKRPFFEGWYLRITTPNEESIALVFHVFDSHTKRPTLRKGVGMQVITPVGTVVVESPDVSTFRADSHELDLRNFFPNNDYFRLTSNRVSGRASSSLIGSIQTVEFDVDIVPKIGWGGGPDDKQFSTAGWLAAFPVFEPHYQVLISKGLASGSLSITGRNGSRLDFDLNNSVVYLEKNWGMTRERERIYMEV